MAALAPSSPSNWSSAGRVLSWIVLGFLFAYAAAGLAASLIPASFMTAALGSSSGAGDAGGLIDARYSALVIRARVTSAVLLLLWSALMWQRRWLSAVMAAMISSARPVLIGAPRRTIKAAWHAWTHERAETILFLVVLLAGIALRLAYLDRDLRHDEAWTYMVYGRRPFYLSPLLLTDVNHHPLNTILIQLSVAMFGNGVAAIRLPAFCFGVACIPAGYALARSVGGRGTALITGALIAGAPPLIEYSVNARGYTGVAFCTLLMLWAGQHALSRPGAVLSTWPLVALAGIVGSYTNIVMVLPGIMAFAWFTGLAFQDGRQAMWPALRQITMTGVAVIAGTSFLYLPFFTVSGWDAIAGSQGIKAGANAMASLATFPRFATELMENWARDFGPACAWAVIILALGSVMLARRRLICLALVGAIAVALIFQFAIVRDPGPERVWLSFMVPVLVLAAAALNGVLVRMSRGLALPATVAIGLVAAMAVSVGESATLRRSVETGYFPAAREVAASLVGMTASDLLAISGVRGDEVTYFASLGGVELQPVHTGAPLRYFRRLHAPAAVGNGTLTLVIDTLLKLCTVQDCVREALAWVPTTGTPVLVRSTDDYTELRVGRAAPSQQEPRQ